MRLGQLKTVTEGVGTPLARSTQFGYDTAGNRTTVTDPLGHTTTTGYDKLNRPVTVTDPAGGVVTVGYDDAGRRSWLTDPVGNTTHWAYDDAGRLTAETDPLGKVTTYAYDAVSELVSVTDRLGQRRVFTRDADGRVTAEDGYAAGGAKVQTRTFGYDEAGNRVSAANPAGSYALTYDKLDRPVTVSAPYGLSLAFQYDANGNRISVTDNKGGVQTSTYDALDRLTAREQAGVAKATWGYDAKGDLATLTRSGWAGGAWQPAGTTTQTFDDLGRVTDVRHANAAGATLAEYAYGYDAADRLTSETVNGVTRTYGYDAAGQLTNDNGTPHTYDKAGNRTDPGYVTGPGNRLLSDGTWSYTYDDAGNLVKKSKGAAAETWTYSYDAAGQLTAASKSASDGGPATDTVGFAYDAYGNRLTRTAWNASSGTTTERYTYDGWDTAKPDPVGGEAFDADLDLDGANAVTARRLFGSGFDDPLARQDAAGNVAWYGADRLGSVRLVFDNSGTITGARDYAGFGAITASSGSGLDRYAFAGMSWDPTLGLSGTPSGGRWYDAASGRWTAEDPLGADPANPYRYVGNAPTNATDPSGLQSDDLVWLPGPPGKDGNPTWVLYQKAPPRREDWQPLTSNPAPPPPPRWVPQGVPAPIGGTWYLARFEGLWKVIPFDPRMPLAEINRAFAAGRCEILKWPDQTARLPGPGGRGAEPIEVRDIREVTAAREEFLKSAAQLGLAGYDIIKDFYLLWIPGAQA